jgi:hypothetical protein
MFVRFVIGSISENAYRLDGVFSRAGELRESGALGKEPTDRLAALLDWFNQCLPVPPFAQIRADQRWSKRIVCWFWGTQNVAVRVMWTMVKLLQEGGTPVRFITTIRPGRILYKDRFQIVAEVPGLREQDLRLVPRRCRASKSR